MCENTVTVKVIQKTSVQSFKRNYLVKFCRDVLGGKQLSKIEEYTPKMNPKIPQNGSQQRERSCKKIFFFFFFYKKTLCEGIEWFSRDRGTSKK